MAVLGAASPVVAQNPLQNGRSVVASPAVLGMGDAAAAFPTNGSSFFYNPAHVVRTTGLLPRFQLGLQGRGSSNLKNYYDFVKDDLEPAIDQGIANLTQDEIDTLRVRALEATRERGYAMAEAPAAFAMRIGPVAFGVGGFVHAESRLRTIPSGGGLPIVEASVLRDVSAIGSAAVDASGFGVNGLAVGVNARVTKRALAIKEKPLDTWGDDEQLYLHEATAVGLDVGVLYDLPVPLPGKLTAGAALYDVVGGTFDYAYKDRYVCGSLSLACNYSGTAPSPALIAGEDSLARLRFGVSPSYRLGVAYTVPTLFGLLAETGVALDYIGYSDPLWSDQPFLAHLSLGAQARLARIVALRAGLNQGYVTAGAGVKLGPLALDYTFYGFEQGQKPGDDASWQHLLSLGVSF